MAFQIQFETERITCKLNLQDQYWRFKFNLKQDQMLANSICKTNNGDPFQTKYARPIKTREN